MRKLLLVISVLTLLATPTSTSAALFQTGRSDKPCSFHKVYIADFGSDPRHINFRRDLEKWLAKKKFALAQRPAEADAVLTGNLSISSGTKYSNLTFKDAELRTANGEKPWRGDFNITTKNAFGWLGRGHIENGAKRIVEKIRASCR